MRKLIRPLCFSLLTMLILTSCLKEKNNIQSTIITEGSKWGITIGSPAEEVYQALQQLDQEKDGKIGYVAYYGQHAYDTPAEIEQRYMYYDAISLQSPGSAIDRVIITYDENQVTAIEAGGGLTDEVEKWPQEISDEISIHKDDEIETLFQKIVAIHDLPAYNTYQIIMPEKTLSKGFDPELASLEQWGFSFEDMIASGKAGMNTAVLYFSDGKLEKIAISYREYEVFN